jgi:hypothetical protein
MKKQGTSVRSMFPVNRHIFSYLMCDGWIMGNSVAGIRKLRCDASFSSTDCHAGKEDHP